jgi:homoserine O-succinyltransferase
MPIRLPEGFPAARKLQSEEIVTLTHKRADKQDIRPLKVVILNLMPTKIATEVQLLRLLSSSSIQIEACFLRVATHHVKHGAEHLDKFYKEFDEIKGEQFDAIVVTGAPVEQLAFEEVDYWAEFQEIMDWARTNVFAKLYICWGAQAGLYLDFGVKKVIYPEKLLGIYKYQRVGKHVLTRGFDDEFMMPQSRYTGLNQGDLADKLAEGELICLATSSDADGGAIFTTHDKRQTYVTGHLEYDRDTLDIEYKRDAKAGVGQMPKNYYPDDDPAQTPKFTWRAHADLFFSNWIGTVYQDTPFDLKELSC